MFILLVFLVTHLFSMKVPLGEVRSGFRYMLQASRVRILPYYIADVTTSMVYALATFTIVFLVDQTLDLNPLIQGTPEDAVWYLLLMTSTFSCGTLWSHILVTFSGIALVAVHFASTLLVKSLSFAFAVLHSVELPPTWYTNHLWPEVRRVARLFGLDKQLNVVGRQLTPFARRTLTLAIAFVGAPKLVILDEPTHQV